MRFFHSQGNKDEDVEAVMEKRLPKRAWCRPFLFLFFLLMIVVAYGLRSVLFRKVTPIDHEGVR